MELKANSSIIIGNVTLGSASLGAYMCNGSTSNGGMQMMVSNKWILSLEDDNNNNNNDNNNTSGKGHGNRLLSSYMLMIACFLIGVNFINK